MKNPYLSVVIPAYNEEKRLPKTLLVIDKYLSRQNYSYEILAVDDGSKDKTVEVISALKSKIKNLKVIANKGNHGKGYVVRQGMLEARGKYRAFTNADNDVSIDQIDKFLSYLKPQGDFDVTIASIGVKGSKITQSVFRRRVIGAVFNWIVQVLLLWGIHDTQRGFKCLTAEATKKVFSKQTIEGWTFDVEILLIARKLGLKIKEVPIIWKNDPETKVSRKAIFTMSKDLLKLKMDLWKGKYNFKS